MKEPAGQSSAARRWKQGVGALVLLGIVCLWVVGMRFVEWASRSRVAAVLAEQPPVPPRPSAAPTAAETGIPLANLSFVGGLFSEDPAKREEMDERIRQLGRFGRACSQAGDGPRDFRQVLRDLRVLVPDGGHVLSNSERHSHLAQFATALELHRRQHGDYPATLDDLRTTSKRALPRKSITGTAYQYERDAETGYRLTLEGDAPAFP